MSAKTIDLMGLGMSPGLAQLLGNTPSTLTTTGTSAGTAATVTTRMVSLNTASSQTGAILPAAGVGFANVGDVVFVGCPTATSGVVYPPTGATINAGASLTVAQNKAAIIWYQSPTVLFAVLLG